MPPVTEADYRELLASYAAALDVAQRGLTIAQTLAQSYRCGVNPPDVVLDAYVESISRDHAHLARLRDKFANVQI